MSTDNLLSAQRAESANTDAARASNKSVEQANSLQKDSNFFQDQHSGLPTETKALVGKGIIPPCEFPACEFPGTRMAQVTGAIEVGNTNEQTTNLDSGRVIQQGNSSTTRIEVGVGQVQGSVEFGNRVREDFVRRTRTVTDSIRGRIEVTPADGSASTDVNEPQSGTAPGGNPRPNNSNNGSNVEKPEVHDDSGNGNEG